MATFRFNEVELMRKIEQLPTRLRVAFAAACTERMTVAYGRFSNLNNRGDALAFNTILSRLWSDLVGDTMSDAEVDEHIESCMKLIPREDCGPRVFEQPAAEDAASALVYTLRCRRDGKAQEAAWAARRVYEALDYFVINNEKIDANAAGAEARVLADPLVQAELARQERDIDELARGAVTINRLWERSNAEAAEFIP